MKAEKEAHEKYDPDVIETMKTELFQEGEVLSGKVDYKIQSPKSFPSKVIMLEMIHEDDWNIENIHDEIFMIMPSTFSVIDSNGLVFNTKYNRIIVWPADQEILEYQIKSEEFKGNSLLPFFLKKNKVEQMN